MTGMLTRGYAPRARRCYDALSQDVSRSNCGRYDCQDEHLRRKLQLETETGGFSSSLERIEHQTGYSKFKNKTVLFSI